MGVPRPAKILLILFIPMQLRLLLIAIIAIVASTRRASSLLTVILLMCFLPARWSFRRALHNIVLFFRERCPRVRQPCRRAARRPMRLPAAAAARPAAQPGCALVHRGHAKALRVHVLHASCARRLTRSPMLPFRMPA